jgi:uncharacterized membrane protein YdjX (TVP38/TMEM64 family)
MTANTSPLRNFLSPRDPLTFRPTVMLLAKATLVVAALPVAWLARQPAAELLALLKDREALTALVHSLGLWGPLALGLTIALQVSVAVLPGHVLMLAGGYLYGFVPGVLINWIATVVASQTNFLLARRYGWPLVYRMAPRELVDHWRGRVRGKGFFFFLMTLVLPIFPSDLMCYLAGFSDLTPRRYAVVNMLGHLPCAIGLSLVGSGLLVLPPGGWVLTVALCAAGLLLWRRFGQALEDRFFPAAESAA